MKSSSPDSHESPGWSFVPSLGANFDYLKFACTDVSLFIVTLHVGDRPEQAPVQPMNLSPAVGVAVSVTAVPCVYFAEQTLPQSIPEPDTEPDPPLPIDRVNCGANVAVTFSASFTFTVQASSQ